jgi:Leucine-rich repeat (LRR) protein
LNYFLDNLSEFAFDFQLENENRYENILFILDKDKIQNKLSTLTNLKLHFSMSQSKTQTEEQSLLFAKFIGASHLKQAEVHVNLVDGFLTDLKSLKTIDLSLDGINKISLNSFKDASPSLEMIDLIECNLKTIEHESFRNLSNLKKLFLHENNLSKIFSKTLIGLFNLIELNLSKCEIESIEDNSFVHLNNLEILNLSFNCFHSISKNTFNGLNKLKCLCLDSCGIKSIEDNSFLNLNNLQHLDLSHGFINKLTPSLFNGLINLKILNLTTCNIETIENESFKHLKMLTNLIMKSNKLKLIDINTFDGLDSLVELDLSNCSIEFIHFNSFKNLPKLTDLYFSFEFYDNISTTITYDQLGLKDKSVIKFKGYFN